MSIERKRLLEILNKYAVDRSIEYQDCIELIQEYILERKGISVTLNILDTMVRAFTIEEMLRSASDYFCRKNNLTTVINKEGQIIKIV